MFGMKERNIYEALNLMSWGNFLNLVRRVCEENTCVKVSATRKLLLGARATFYFLLFDTVDTPASTMPRNTENSKAAAAAAEAAKVLAKLAGIVEDDNNFQDTEPQPRDKRRAPQASPTISRSSAGTLTSVWENLPLTMLQLLADVYHLGHPESAAKIDYAAQLDRFHIPITALQDLSCLHDAPRHQRVQPAWPDDGASQRAVFQPPQWLLNMQTPNLPKQRTDETRQQTRFITNFDQLVDAVARRFPTPHLDRLKRFRQLKPDSGKSFFNFGERLREEFELCVQLPLPELDAADNVIQFILKEQLLNSAETGLRDELHKKWSKNRHITWDDFVDVAESYLLNHPATGSGNQTARTGPRQKVDLPPKQWCDFHKKSVRHSTQECRLHLRQMGSAQSTSESTSSRQVSNSSSTSAAKSSFSDAAGPTCFHCNRIGHYAKECPQVQGNAKSSQ
ncbi:unnamed protein product [Notodromas monacha]|uniref:CCHC-type domain-containing protein n=1 Tax=Notodromas monacha TaxID=399045 RepID=A0A7R9BHV7_9CRUS|nr:unnamed protein product [Notodromas monacha]CAG0914731.1 unnamed protein product [Notodromas monacha]